MTADALYADGTDREGPVSRLFLLLSFVVPGLTYPLWPWVVPESYVDPPVVWILLGGCFLSVPLIERFKRFSRRTLMNIMSGIASLVTLHLFVLASINDMAPFYSVGSTMAVIATVIFIRSTAALALYSAFVVTLAVTLFAIEPDERKVAYWGGPVPVLGLAYYRLANQLSQRQTLEAEIRDRTWQLSNANRKLHEEIEERRRLEEELRVLHKMEAVGRLAGGVAHDFNNLLATIAVYADLLTDGLAEESPLRDQVDQIRNATRQAASLTQQLLTLGRRSNVQLDPLDLNEVVADACATLRSLLGEGIQIGCHLGEGPYPIVANAVQLQQILLNLGLNARDAMSGIGTLTVSTTRCEGNDLAGRDADHSLAGGEYALLTVSDTGCGMTAETRERAFDPFFTTKDRDRGTGLGLSTVHGIVTQAGGQIRLHSEAGAGTRIEVYWPLAPGLDLDIGTPVEAVRSSGSGQEILLVEDEAPLRGALLAVLTQNGYRVTEADNGERALEIAREQDPAFDLVLTDVVMPGMGGLELAERLATTSPETRVLLMSGHLSQEELARRAGDRHFLAKPFAADPLIARLREILDGPAERM